MSLSKRIPDGYDWQVAHSASGYEAVIKHPGETYEPELYAYWPVRGEGTGTNEAEALKSALEDLADNAQKAHPDGRPEAWTDPKRRWNS